MVWLGNWMEVKTLHGFVPILKCKIFLGVDGLLNGPGPQSSTSPSFGDGSHVASPRHTYRWRQIRLGIGRTLTNGMHLFRRRKWCAGVAAGDARVKEGCLLESGKAERGSARSGTGFEVAQLLQQQLWVAFILQSWLCEIECSINAKNYCMVMWYIYMYRVKFNMYSVMA